MVCFSELALYNVPKMHTVKSWASLRQVLSSSCSWSLGFRKTCAYFWRSAPLLALVNLPVFLCSWWGADYWVWLLEWASSAVAIGFELGEGSWGRKKCRRVPKREGDWQGGVPRCALPRKKALQNRDLELPIFQGSVPSCSPHPTGSTRTSGTPVLPRGLFSSRPILRLRRHDYFQGILEPQNLPSLKHDY